MTTLSIEKQFDIKSDLSERAAELMRLFGLRAEGLERRRFCHHCEITLMPGQICYIAGASGSGKSVLLNAFYEQVPGEHRIRLEEIDCGSDERLIDCTDGPVPKAVATLSKTGLSDVFTMLEPLRYLSSGQQWRYQLAKAIASGRQWIFADEFTSMLDRISAAVIAINLRKVATRTKTFFVLASCHEDILAELQPDVVILKYLNGTGHVVYRDGRRETLSRKVLLEKETI